MRKEDIISKGKYSYPQPDALISIKEYLFVRNEEGKKMLLLRFANKRAEVCTSFGFILYRLDARGRILGEERFESSDGMRYRANSTFGFDRKIEVEEKCVEFKIKLLHATYGEYAYKIENGDAVVDFAEKKKAPVAPVVGTDKDKIKPRRITHRALETPGMFAIITLVILAVAFLITGFQLRKFMDEEKEFTLAGLKYEFVDEDQKDPGDEVIIVGATEKYENVLIPAEIEGYTVVGVKDGAFKGDTTLKNVKIEGVDIGKEVFLNCENLESVELIGVVELGEKSFAGCKSLNEIKANSLEKIGNEAFKGCKSLKKVTFTHRKESTRLHLGSAVFSGCTKLESVSISQLIVYPEDIAIFNGTTSIKTLTLKNFGYNLPILDEDETDDTENNESNGEIGPIMPFSESTLTIKDLFGDVDAGELSLERVTIGYVDSLSPDFCRGLKSLKSFTITKSDITQIPAFAFYGCSSLEEINLADVRSVGEGAFYDCESLKDTKITDETPLVSIGDEAFYGCSSLDSIIVPPTVTEIGKRAFANCSVEVFEFPAGLKAYGKEVLLGCDNIKELTLPTLSREALTYIFGANKGNISSIPTSLKKVTVLNCTDVIGSAFKNCASLEEIVLPETVKTIGVSAFEGCKSLKRINLTSALKTVGTNAFKGSGIESIDLSSVEKIGIGAFADCNSLKEISVPFIGESADALTTAYLGYIFGSASPQIIGYVPSSLEIVRITGAVSTIPTYAFYGCSSIKTIELSSGVTSIGEKSFSGCSSLKSFDMSVASTIGQGAFENTAIEEATLSNQLTAIPDSLFVGSQSLTKVTLGSSVTEIGNGAFSGCISLKEINLPSSLKKIGENAFSNASSLESLDLSSVTEVGSRAFYSTSLKEAIFPSNAVVGSSAFEGCYELKSIVIPVNSDSSYFGYFFGTSNSAIPASIEEVTLIGTGSLQYGAMSDCENIKDLYLKGFTSISGYSVSSCDNLRFVQIPETVSSVSSSSFYDSNKLYEINNLSSVNISAGFGAGTTAIYVGSTRAPFVVESDVRFSCFNGTWYVTSLPAEKTVDVPSSFKYENETISQFKIPKNLLRNEQTIEQVKFPAGVTEIGANAFYGAQSLTAVLFDKDAKVDKISSLMFYGSTSLEQVALPSSVKTIEREAFSGCSSLNDISMPGDIEIIGDEAFYGCSSLPRIVLGYNLSSIGTRAFYGCTHLYDVYNISPLTVVAGSTANGYVGRYALKVHVDLSALPSDEVYVDGIGTFRNKDNEWLLISYTGNDSELDLTKVVINGKEITSFRIAEGAFRNNGVIEKVIAGSSLKQIQSEAFYGCSRLKSVDLRRASLDTIEESTFQACQALRYAYLPSTVKSIDSYAFAGCARLEEISMPSSLETIGSNAFYNCSRLISIELPSGLRAIGSSAFDSCSSLYEIINKSSYISLTKGSTANGYVAYYAKGIFSSTGSAFERLNKNGCKLININDTWYLYAVDDKLSVELLDIPDVDGNLIIKNDAFYGASVRYILLPTNVTKIEPNAFSYIQYSVSRVYYEGSLDDSNQIMGVYYLPGTIYYYDVCVHNSSHWTYKDGKISTDECTLKYTTEKEANCFEAGYEVGRCECNCGYEVINDLPQLSHSFINGVCSKCKLQKVSITPTIFEQMVENGTITVSDFEYNEDNKRFESTIQGKGDSQATFMIVAEERTEVSLIYGVSSEYHYDSLTVTQNGISKDSMTGENASSRTFLLEAGDTLIFKYSKDVSGNDGDDLGYLTDITILVKTEQK